MSTCPALSLSLAHRVMFGEGSGEGSGEREDMERERRKDLERWIEPNRAKEGNREKDRETVRSTE